MSRTRIKICGITRVEDALAAVELGADAIGLVFYPPSPRAVSVAQAREILATLPPFVTSVGLFVNNERAAMESLLAQLPIDLLQFHGDESPQQCRGFGRPYIKALRMRPGQAVGAEMDRFTDAQGFLLDTYQEGVPGGTGQVFDWSLVPKDYPKPLVLAGGLTPENVAQAVSQVRPYAVDVSGGVEAGKGIKDKSKIAAFIRGVRSVQTDGL